MKIVEEWSLQDTYDYPTDYCNQQHACSPVRNTMTHLGTENISFKKVGNSIKVRSRKPVQSQNKLFASSLDTQF